MKYMAWSMRNDDGGATSYLPVASPKCEHDLERLAERHARAMKAVLLAARAWKLARYLRDEAMRACVVDSALIAALIDAEMRLAAAQERLEKIEKEVTRG